MENLNNMNELEEMRRELQVLKDKVERKGVLNERLVKGHSPVDFYQIYAASLMAADHLYHSDDGGFCRF